MESWPPIYSIGVHHGVRPNPLNLLLHTVLATPSRFRDAKNKGESHDSKQAKIKNQIPLCRTSYR